MGSDQRKARTVESVILKAWLCLEFSRFASQCVSSSSFSVSAAGVYSGEDATSSSSASSSSLLPLAINTWGFSNATESARASLLRGGSALDAVVAAATRCEVPRRCAKDRKTKTGEGRAVRDGFWGRREIGEQR